MSLRISHPETKAECLSSVRVLTLESDVVSHRRNVARREAPIMLKPDREVIGVSSDKQLQTCGRTAGRGCEEDQLVTLSPTADRHYKVI